MAVWRSGGGKHARAERPARKTSGRNRRPGGVIVAYDGEKTEDDYFRNWRAILGDLGLSLEPVQIVAGKTVDQALEDALEKIGDFEGSQVWCVFDVDASTQGDVNRAKDIAHRRAVTLSLSCRSFEVWLGLHFGRSASPITTEADAVNLVKRSYSDFSARNKVVPFRLLHERVRIACENGKWLRDQGCSNPSTDLDLLVEELLRRMDRALARAKSRK